MFPLIVRIHFLFVGSHVFLESSFVLCHSGFLTSSILRPSFPLVKVFYLGDLPHSLQHHLSHIHADCLTSLFPYSAYYSASLAVFTAYRPFSSTFALAYVFADFVSFCFTLSIGPAHTNFTLLRSVTPQVEQPTLAASNSFLLASLSHDMG